MLQVVGDLPNKEVAKKIGIGSDSTIGNWKRGENFSQPSANLVVRFARAYGVPLPEALAAAGYGTRDEYSTTILTAPDVSTLSVDEITRIIESGLTEIRKRSKFSPRDDRPSL